MKKILILPLLFISGWTFAQAIDLNRENCDPEYVESIVGQSQRIVDKLRLIDAKIAEDIHNVIANRYFELNDIYEMWDAEIERVKESGLISEAKNEALKAAENEKDAALYRSHFVFPTNLSLLLDEKQIKAIKDGITYGVVKVTYDLHLGMIPTLKEEEKAQIYAWSTEAREFALDTEDSNKEHAAFGKYKGRINNYLAKHGYDLREEREEWYKHTKARGGSI